jgi:glycosyl transferase family 25
MQVFYINLERQTDRRLFVGEQFSALGLVGTRIVAVTPADIPAELVAQYCQPARGYWVTETELACSLSHRKAMEAFLASGDDYAAVFEDDVLLSKSLPTFLDAVEAATPAIDILRLETFLDPIRLVDHNDPPIAGHAIRRALSFTGGTAGYVVSRRAAQMLLEEKDILFKQADRVMFNPYERLHHRLVMRHVVPALCVQLDRLPENHGSTFQSHLAPSRAARVEAERPYRLARLGHVIVDILRYEVLGGIRKTAEQLLRRVEKQLVPFKSD